MRVLQYIADNSRANPISVGGDHHLRTPMTLRFYARYFPDHQFQYVTMETVAVAKPEWIIWTRNPDQLQALTLSDGRTNYRLGKVFPVGSDNYLPSYLFQRQ